VCYLDTYWYWFIAIINSDLQLFLGHLHMVIVFGLCKSSIWSVYKAIEIKTAHHFFLLQKSHHAVLTNNFKLALTVDYRLLEILAV